MLRGSCELALLWAQVPLPLLFCCCAAESTTSKLCVKFRAQKAFTHCLRWLPAAGPAPCYLFSFLLRGGKTQLDGNKVTAGMVRHAVAQLCPVGAWGRYLVHRFTIKKHAFPDPKNEKEWHKAAMWPGLKWYQNITYEALRIDIVAVLKRCGIFIRKTCHAFRMFAAQEMELLGFPLDVSARLGTLLVSLYVHVQAQN